MPENNNEQPKDQIDLAKMIGNMKPREQLLSAAALGEFLAHTQKLGETARIAIFGAALVGNELMKAKEQNVDFTSGKEIAKFVGHEILDLKNFAWFSIALAASVPESLPLVSTAVEGTVNFFKSNPKIGEAIITAFLGSVGIAGILAGASKVAGGAKEVWAKNLGPAIERTRQKSDDFFTALKEGRVEFQSILRSPIKEVHPKPEVAPTPIGIRPGERPRN